MRDKRLAKIAAAAYDRVLDQNAGRINCADVYKEALEELRVHGLEEDILYEVAQNAVDKEDGKRRRQASSRQLDLLTGEEAAYEGMWALGDGARVQIKHANKDDVLRHRQLQKEDLARKVAADEREERQTDCYFPYMTDNTVTVPQAVARWRAAISRPHRPES